MAVVANTVRAWKDAQFAYVAANVAPGGALPGQEFQASTPLVDQNGNAKSAAQLQADILAALKALYLASNPPAPGPVSVPSQWTVG